MEESVSEHCLKCGGPVDVAEQRIGGKRAAVATTLRALPDTLEGIEAEAKEILEKGYVGYKPYVLLPALTRLFYGCTECGREPQCKTS